MMNKLQRGAYLVITAIAVAVLTLFVPVILSMGLGLPAGGAITPDKSPLDLMIAPLRTFLLRNALRNTIIVLAVSLPLAYLLGLASVTLMTQNARSRGVMAWLLLLPLAMPVALAMPAWRQIFLASPALAGGVIPALIAIGVIQAWRILPFAALFLLLARSVDRRRAAVGLTLCFTAYVVISDVGVTLLFTGGEPFNATHVLSSWIYQTAVAAAMPGHAAVMALGLMVILAGLAWGFAHYAGALNVAFQERYARLAPDVIAASRRRRPPQRQPRKRRGFVTSAEHTPQAMGGVLLASPVIIVLLLPIAVPLVMTGDMARWPGALGELFGERGYGYWLANTILLAGITALVAVVVVIPIGRLLASWPSKWSARLSQGVGILGMTVLPVAFLPLAWLQNTLSLSDGRWILALLYASATLCIGVWLVALVCRSKLSVPRPALTSWLVLLSYLIVTNEMASALALSNGASRMQALNSGLPTRLVADISVSMPALGLAILLPMVLLLIFYWWLVRSGIAPLIDFTGGME